MTTRRAATPGRRRRGSRPLAVLLLVATALATALATGIQTPASASPLEVGYRDSNYSTSVTAPTGQKPESKLWYADGTWWGVLWDTGAKRFTIQRFNLATQATNAWTSTGVAVDVRRNSEPDVLWDSSVQKLYVVTHLKDTDTSTADKGLRVLRFGYAGSSYTLEATTTLADQKVEAAVLDKDSTGRLWVTYTAPNGSGGNTVKVAHTTTGDAAWTAPFPLPVSSSAVNTSADDISTLVAYGDSAGRKIGVLWSNQLTGTVYFASHVDGAADSAWTLTSLCSEMKCPDDHLNIKSVDADPSGNLYAIVKTSLNDKSPTVSTDPLIVVYRLSPGGAWTQSTAWTVGEGNVTRGILVLDKQNRRVYAFAAGPCCSGGTVYVKSASFDNLSFPRGNGTAFIKSATATEKVNNPTSTKQSVNSTTGLLVLAGIDSTRDYVHNYLSLGGPSGGGGPTGDTTAPTITAVRPVAGTKSASVSANVTATFSEAVDASSVSGSTMRLQAPGGTTVTAKVSYNARYQRAVLNPVSNLSAGTTYTATVQGGAGGVRDLAGNLLASDRVWSFTTAG